MKTYPTQNIRNVVLLGSTKSGKTTLSEAMLYEGKVIERRGTVEAKNTVSDNAEIEQIQNSILLILRAVTTSLVELFLLSRCAIQEFYLSMLSRELR